MYWHFPLLFAALTSTYVCSPQNDLSLEELGSDIGIQVFNQLVKTRAGNNVVVSPHGIASLLGILQLGANSKTLKQLTTVMKYTVNGVGKVLKKINKAIVAKKNKDIVKIANVVFAKSGLKMEAPFVSRNRAVFQCSVKNINFKDPNAASEAMNQWVRSQTEGMIDSVLAPDDIDSVLTRLVVTNTIYFKGLWKSRFQPENTKMRTFNEGDGKTYQVPMMFQKSEFRYGTTITPNDLTYKTIELPYHGGSISMLIALPAQSSTPLSAIIPHISTKTIQSWMTTMTPMIVEVILPKFTAEAKTDLKDPLKELGIRDMFDSTKANFAKITKSENLYVSQLLQKAKIEVSEDGTEASAATVAMLGIRTFPSLFVADRPFLFFIRHNPTGAVLFMGQITKP